jgi:hypothetical protein
MVAWIALAISTISLVVNIIVQRDKLKSFSEELSNWLVQQVEKRKATTTVNRFATPDSGERKEIKNPQRTIPLNTSFFLLSIISSAILGLYEIQTPITLIGLGVIVFTLVSIIPVNIVILVFAKKRYRWWVYALVFILTLFMIVMYAFMWSFTTFLVLFQPVSVFYAGVIAGVIVAILTWLYVQRAEHR